MGKPHISKKAIKLARDLQSELIDCGMKSWRAYSETNNTWDPDGGECCLLISGFDVNGKFHTWREGE